MCVCVCVCVPVCLCACQDTAKREQQRLEQLQEDNRQLERQKAELIAAFKKQLRLIDVLKRQKVRLQSQWYQKMRPD